ncbi:MAG: polysaccharide biosynthesis tyrosine autokinase [Methylacidiphilales bacterium]|nr:polysaccharide biosynthesis tyrosine autokinase [Candidatus Methylacidiphilales bacterium]
MSPEHSHFGHDSDTDFLSMQALSGHLMRVVLERFWAIILILVLVVAGTFAYLHYAKRLYRATAVIEVEQKEEQIVEVDAQKAQDLSHPEIIKTIEQNLSSTAFLKRVLGRDEIKNDPQLFSGWDLKDPNMEPLLLAQVLYKNSNIEVTRGTRLIEISVYHGSPETAKKIANGIANQYLEERSRSKTGTSTSAFEFLIAKTDELKRKLQSGQDSLQVYTDAVKYKETILAERSNYKTLSQRYRSKHPKMLQSQSLLAQMARDFDAEISKIKQAAPPEAAFWQEQEDKWAASGSEDKLGFQLKAVEARYNFLSTELQTDKDMLDSLLKQMKESDLSKQLNPIEVKLEEPALLPLYPAIPNLLLVWAIAAAGGLMLSLGLAFALDGIDNTLKTVDEAERCTGCPILGAIPRSKQSLLKGEVMLEKYPGSNVSEAVRSLRVSLGLLGHQDDRKIILFTSAVPQEGKSFSSANVSVSFAQQGLKTLLIDVDLRRPMLHQILAIPTEQPGVVNYLTGQNTLDGVIWHSPTANLDVIWAGGRAPNPAELLASGAIGNLIREAAERYDRIILDSAPVNSVSDTLSLVKYVQTLCVVIRAGRTPRRAVLRALRVLKQAEAPITGIILNYLPQRGRMGMDPYHYYYSSEDSYGKVYGSH